MSHLLLIGAASFFAVVGHEGAIRLMRSLNRPATSSIESLLQESSERRRLDWHCGTDMC